MKTHNHFQEDGPCQLAEEVDWGLGDSNPGPSSRSAEILCFRLVKTIARWTRNSGKKKKKTEDLHGNFLSLMHGQDLVARQALNSQCTALLLSSAKFCSFWHRHICIYIILKVHSSNIHLQFLYSRIKFRWYPVAGCTDIHIHDQHMSVDLDGHPRWMFSWGSYVVEGRLKASCGTMFWDAQSVTQWSSLRTCNFKPIWSGQSKAKFVLMVRSL